MLVYSATTAKAYKTYHATEAMTTSQKEQFHRAFKKYAIEEFKKKEKLVSYKFDGTKKLLSRNVFSVTVYSFYHSANLKNLAMYKKCLIGTILILARTLKLFVKRPSH